jgi:hypothetical protein
VPGCEESVRSVVIPCWCMTSLRELIDSRDLEGVRDAARVYYAENGIIKRSLHLNHIAN